MSAKTTPSEDSQSDESADESSTNDPQQAISAPPKEPAGSSKENGEAVEHSEQKRTSEAWERLKVIGNRPQVRIGGGIVAAVILGIVIGYAAGKTPDNGTVVNVENQPSSSVPATVQWPAATPWEGGSDRLNLSFDECTNLELELSPSQQAEG